MFSRVKTILKVPNNVPSGTMAAQLVPECETKYNVSDEYYTCFYTQDGIVEALGENLE